MKKQRKPALLFFMLIFLSACSAQSAQDPNFILTVIAGTQDAAVYQTQMAELLYTSTPTLATLRPTLTMQPTATNFVFRANTPKPSPSATRTPYIRTTWPDWKTGAVVSMPGGSGANIGTSKMFSGLKGLSVIVVRENGVKLRSIPSKAIGGPMEEEGSAFTLTGIMNKNPQFDWLFAQIIAANGKTYWVGGSIGDKNTDPTFALQFYYPNLTPSPTPLLTSTPTP